MSSLNGDGEDEALASPEIRIEKFIDELLEDDGLSEDAEALLQNLKDDGRPLSDIATDDLAEMLLDCHP